MGAIELIELAEVAVQRMATYLSGGGGGGGGGGGEIADWIVDLSV